MKIPYPPPIQTVHMTQLSDLLWHLARAEHPLEYLIHATPSGPARNHLTEVNIHLMQIAEALGKAMAYMPITPEP
jgi:hypothetical protein